MIKKNGILSLILRTLMFVIVSISMAACPWSAEAVETRDYDVIVVGAGTGGVAAAIQAGRLGARVALFEDTNVLGGQMVAPCLLYTSRCV